MTLEALLQLKRHERPDDSFWDSFESDFQRRRLHALVEQRARRDWLWSPFVRAVAIGLPALLLAGMGVFWSGLEGPSTRLNANPERNQLAAMPEAITSIPRVDSASRTESHDLDATNMAVSQFVMDAFDSSADPSAAFRKVLYTPAIRLSAPSGSFYVKDTMSAGSYQVTTADLKQGSNF